MYKENCWFVYVRKKQQIKVLVWEELGQSYCLIIETGFASLYAKNVQRKLLVCLYAGKSNKQKCWFMKEELGQSCCNCFAGLYAKNVQRKLLVCLCAEKATNKSAGLGRALGQSY